MHKFPIGTQYKTRGKHPRLCTVIDQLTTYNSKGELISIRYVTSHSLGGQAIFEHDVCETTVKMGLVENAA